VQLWWQQVLLIFLRTHVIFCTKTSLISYGGYSSSQGCALLGVFLLGQSPPLPRGSRRLCTAAAGAHAATSRYLPLATQLQQTRCTSLLLPVDGTDRRGRTDTRQLHRRLPHMRAAAILQCAVISEIICRFLRQLCPLQKPTCGYR